LSKQRAATLNFFHPNKKVNVAFYGEDRKPIPPAEQTTTVIKEATAGKTKLEFDKTSDGLVSKEVLPEYDGYRIVLRIRNTVDAKPQNFRIEYHTEVCWKCNRAEYACVCTGDEHGH